ncbi:unnamed protein product [Lampetra planeri]
MASSSSVCTTFPWPANPRYCLPSAGFETVACSVAGSVTRLHSNNSRHSSPRSRHRCLLKPGSRRPSHPAAASPPGRSCCWQDEEEAVGGSPPWLRGRKADERLVTATAGDGPEWPPTAGEEGCSLAMGLGGFFHRRAVGNDDGFGVGRGRWEAFIQQRTDEDSFGQGGADSQLVAASRAGDASRERCSSNNAS